MKKPRIYSMAITQLKMVKKAITFGELDILTGQYMYAAIYIRTYNV